MERAVLRRVKAVMSDSSGEGAQAAVEGGGYKSVLGRGAGEKTEGLGGEGEGSGAVWAWQVRSYLVGGTTPRRDGDGSG